MRKFERISSRQVRIFLLIGAAAILAYTVFSGWAWSAPTDEMQMVSSTIVPATSSPVVVTVLKKEAPPKPKKVPKKIIPAVPPLVLDMATSSATSTATSMPIVMIEATSTTGMSAAPATTTATTTTIEPVATTTPYVPSAQVLNGGGLPSPYFSSSEEPLVLTIAECVSSPNPLMCLITTTAASLSWTSFRQAVRYGIWVNGAENTTVTGASQVLTLADQATTTLYIVAYDIRNDVLQSESHDVRVEVPILSSSVHDSFDSYNSAGWQTFGGSVKLFDVDDDPATNCFSSGCVVGSANNAFTTSVPRIYLEQAPAITAGAFTVYARARAGSLANPHPVISLCKESSSCVDGSRIDFFTNVQVDDTWHQYYFAWRQGSTHVESCIVQDSTNPSGCSWTDEGFALGTKFDGVALWSSTGYRADFGGNLWFDELVAL